MSMRRPTPAKQRPEISRHDRTWIEIYLAMIEHYKLAPVDWYVAAHAVRLYMKRVGLDVMLTHLMQYGVAAVAELCRREIKLRQDFFIRMLAEHPPEDTEENRQMIEEMTQELAEDLAVIDSPHGAMRVLRFLERLLKREKALNLGTAKTASPAGSLLPRAGS
jgi:hypothetical protein